MVLGDGTSVRLDKSTHEVAQSNSQVVGCIAHKQCPLSERGFVWQPQNPLALLGNQVNDELYAMGRTMPERLYCRD